MSDSAIMDSPPPPDAGPSRGRYNIEQVLRNLDVDSFDWKAYEGTYKGRALITRLMHIPGRLLSFPATNDPRLLAFARTALVRAIPRVKETWDHGLYLRCVSQINETLGQPATSIPRGADSDDEGDDDEPMSGEANEAEGKPDMAWVKRVKEEEKKEITKTDVELRGYMSNLIKESIRVSSSAAIRPVVCEPDGEVTYLALAQMHNKRGDPVAANRSYAAAREFSVGGVQLLEQGLGQIETCLVFNALNGLGPIVQKMSSAVDRAYTGGSAAGQAAPRDAASITAGDLRADEERRAQQVRGRSKASVLIGTAEALVALDRKRYEAAGKLFAQHSATGLGDWDGQTMSSSDMALLAGLLILATGSRNVIRDELLSGTAFRSALDDNQQWLLEAVRLSTDAKYGEMTALIKEHAADIALNPFLSPHLDDILRLLNTRAIVQYIQPFSSVSLPAMSSSIRIQEDQLLNEIESLLGKGEITGKIDLIDKVLHIKAVDPRRDAYTSALAVGSSITSSTRAALIRMKMQEAKIQVSPRDPDAALDAALDASAETVKQQKATSSA